MDINQFAVKVSEMRHLQKEYFRIRNSSLLAHAKIKEKEVDKILDQLIPKVTSKQTNLF